MARNPKDVLVSFFHFHQIAGFLPNPSSFEDFVDEFLEGTGESHGLRWLSEPPWSPSWCAALLPCSSRSEVTLLLLEPSHTQLGLQNLLCFLLVQASSAPGLTT